MIVSYGASDVGLRRQLNEDHFLVDDALGLYVVADGMGGHNAGEVASRLAVESVAKFVRRSRQDDEITWPYGVDPTKSVDANRLITAIRLANRRVWREADNRQEYTGMGTTIVAALVGPKTIAIAHAGDSRAYRFRDGRLEQLTVDDSWVQAAIAEGLLSPDEAEIHPMRNIITKAVGAKEDIDVPVREEPLVDGDLFLLSTDGLHGMVGDETIASILRRIDGDLHRGVRELIAAANDAGGKDNVTVVLIEYRQDESS